MMSDGLPKTTSKLGTSRQHKRREVANGRRPDASLYPSPGFKEAANYDTKYVSAFVPSLPGLPSYEAGVGSDIILMHLTLQKSVRCSEFTEEEA